MTIVLLIAIIWALSALLRYAERQRQQKEKEARKREEDRMRQEWRDAKLKVDLETKRLIALEREQMRQAKEQEKLAKEQEKQAAILEKHEKRIEALEYKVRKLDRDIESQNELLADYYAQLDWLLLQQSGTVTGGKEFAAWQNKIVTKNNQIRKAENKIADMKDAKAMAERELAA